MIATLALALPAVAAKRPTVEKSVAAAFAPNGVFNSLEFETNAESGIGSWRKAAARLAGEQAAYKACDQGSDACPSHLRRWRQELGAWRDLSAKAKLIQVNRFANAAIRYSSDKAVYRTADFWATPAQSLKGFGDCEDYVLLKYASLRALGFDDKSLRIVIVNDLRKSIGHAVLSVRTETGTYVLDNQDTRVLRHDTISYYAPVYSINATGRWINIATRSLKVKKPAPVMLLASADELGDIVPAAPASGEKSFILLPQLKPAMSAPVQTRQLSSATAIAARLDTFGITPIAMLLRPTIEG